jgi:hydrogenase large subunit
MARTTLEIPMNRVEGDLEIRVTLEDGVVVDAASCGTMFRGFENLLRGRGALDGLVITPRICGICTTAHLIAAARALDDAAGIEPTETGRLVRDVALAIETVQSDLRQVLLMFAPDFASDAHRDVPLHGEAVRRHRPFEGTSVIGAIRATKHLLEIIAILGGQWPHATFAVPGGTVSAPSAAEATRCRHILSTFRAYYERQVLGCSVERFSALASADALDAWLDESPAHADGDLGFVLRFARSIGLDRLGRGHGRFLSAPGLLAPAGGVMEGLDAPTALDARLVTEDVASSWAASYATPRHPSEGETKPYASGREGPRYSWAKAARYDGRPAESGALATLLAGRDPLFVDLLRASSTNGPNALLRVLARLVRPARLLPIIDAALATLGKATGPSCPSRVDIEDGVGQGLADAPRGMLGHWIAIERGKIARYQIITPTGWNGSPRDGAGVRGPWEEALVGTRVADPENPIELGYVVRSFDPCLVCTVHAVDVRGTRGARGHATKLRIGA